MMPLLNVMKTLTMSNRHSNSGLELLLGGHDDRFGDPDGGGAHSRCDRRLPLNSSTRWRFERRLLRRFGAMALTRCKGTVTPEDEATAEHLVDGPY